jgi:hypothetical protein
MNYLAFLAVFFSFGSALADSSFLMNDALKTPVALENGTLPQSFRDAILNRPVFCFTGNAQNVVDSNPAPRFAASELSFQLIANSNGLQFLYDDNNCVESTGDSVDDWQCLKWEKVQRAQTIPNCTELAGDVYFFQQKLPDTATRIPESARGPDNQQDDGLAPDVYSDVRVEPFLVSQPYSDTLTLFIRFYRAMDIAPGSYSTPPTTEIHVTPSTYKNLAAGNTVTSVSGFDNCDLLIGSSSVNLVLVTCNAKTSQFAQSFYLPLSIFKGEYEKSDFNGFSGFPYAIASTTKTFGKNDNTLLDVIQSLKKANSVETKVCYHGDATALSNDIKFLRLSVPKNEPGVLFNASEGTLSFFENGKCLSQSCSQDDRDSGTTCGCDQYESIKIGESKLTTCNGLAPKP